MSKKGSRFYENQDDEESEGEEVDENYRNLIWETLSIKLPIPVSGCAITSINNGQQAVITGGDARNGHQKTTLLFDINSSSIPTSYSFTPLPDLSISRHGHRSLFHDGFLYALEGNGGDRVERLHTPNLSNKATSPTSWQLDVPQLDEVRPYDPAFAICDNFMYVFGGKNEDNTTLSSVERLEIKKPSNTQDGISTKWEKVTASLRHAISQHAVATVGEDIFIFGGSNDENHDGSVEVEIFNTRTQTFSDGPSMPKLVRGAVAIVFKKYIILIGGILEGSGSGHSMMLDTVSNEWKIFDIVLNAPRYEHDAAILADGTIIVCGGQGNNGKLDSIEIISFEDLTGIDVLPEEFSDCSRPQHVNDAILRGLRSGNLVITKGMLGAAERKAKLLGDGSENSDIYQIKNEEGAGLLHEFAEIGIPAEITKQTIEKTRLNRYTIYGETPLMKCLKYEAVNYREDQLENIFLHMQDIHPQYFHPVTNKPNLGALYNFGFIRFPQLKEGSFQLVACIDIAGFKQVNDEFDHTTGDVALNHYAEKMQALADEINTGNDYSITNKDKEKDMTIVHVYHKSGDEFFVLFQCQSKDTLVTLYTKWCKQQIGKIEWSKSEEDKEALTFLRLGCVWSEEADCNFFFNKKINSILDFDNDIEKLIECGKKFEKEVMTESDKLEIKMKKSLEEKYEITRENPLTKDKILTVLKNCENVSELTPP